MNRRHNNTIKKERIIDLTDIGRHNTMPVVRRELRSMNDPPTQADTINVINEENYEKGLGQPREYIPPDPEPGEDERLENEGATIIHSTTYFPASGKTISKRSQTPEESMANREQYYLDR